MHDGHTLLAFLDALEGETHDKEAFTALTVGYGGILSVGILHSRESGLDGLQDIGRGGCIVRAIEFVPIVKRYA